MGRGCACAVMLDDRGSQRFCFDDIASTLLLRHSLDSASISIFSPRLLSQKSPTTALCCSETTKHIDLLLKNLEFGPNSKEILSPEKPWSADEFSGRFGGFVIFHYSGRIPEAALMARSYVPSKVSEIVSFWRNDLNKVNKKAAESLADMQECPNLFEDWQVSLALESKGAETRGIHPPVDIRDERTFVFVFFWAFSNPSISFESTK